MMSEEAIVRRLITDGDGQGEDRRLANLYKLVYHFANVGNPETDREDALAKINALVDQATCAMQKTVLVYQMNQLQADYHKETLTSIEKDISEAQERINYCKQELQDAKQIRKHRQEYDLMAKMIDDHPTRADSQEKLRDVNAELAKLETKRRQLEDSIDRKKKQLHCFLTEALFLLEDDEEEESESLSMPIGDRPNDDDGETMDVA